MIIYQDTKRNFMMDVRDNSIADILEDKFRERGVVHNNPSEHRAWMNSMQFMRNALDDTAIDDECQVAIEYQIPLTSKRVDFMISGKDDAERSHVIVVELKQWEDSQQTGRPDIVYAFTGHANRAVCHPSYQAYTYAKTIENYNEDVARKNIRLHPCAYLHNYLEQNRKHIDNDFYHEIISLAPIFLERDTVKLRNFIKRFIHKKDGKDVLMSFDYGRLRPSKALQDTIVSMIRGNQEFYLIDEQKVAYETILDCVEKATAEKSSSSDSTPKHTIIVRGGPGTGKSVIAIQLLATLLQKGLSCAYVTKNSAPREVYSAKLIGQNYRKGYVKNLFMSSGCFVDEKRDVFDCLICDEAHRLNEKSGMFHNKGTNQAKEIIHASKVSVFFIDEDQIVTTSDFGNVRMIKEMAREENSHVIDDPSLTLVSQFRCNGSDGYLAFLDNLLGIRETANTAFDFDYDFRIYSSPTKMREILREKNGNNKARLVAGYCYNWVSKTDDTQYDILLKDGFKAQWNFNKTKTWAIDPDSFDQVGCIHTSQGLELDYVGVIIGRDLIYQDGHVQTDCTMRAKTDKSLRGIKSSRNYALADRIIRNTYRVLLSRGQKGCFVYCEDDDLARYLSAMTGKDIQ